MALVKTQRYANAGAASISHRTYFRDASNNQRLVYVVTLASISFQQDNIWHVLEAGMQIELFGGVAGSILDYWISGAELDA